MSDPGNRPAQRPVTITLAALLLAAAIATAAAAAAHAADYKMVLCAAGSSAGSYATSTNTTSQGHPNGIFDFTGSCGPSPDPAGNAAFLRIAEHEASGNAGEGAYGRISWSPPSQVAILAAGGYTREPNAFNEGWRARFWAEGYDGSTSNILVQGTGLANSGVNWAPTSTFAPHLWPFAGYGFYRRFAFELACVRAAGCDRTNFNAADANTFVLVLADTSPPSVQLNDSGSLLLADQWVRGAQPLSYALSEQGSGIRSERVRVDGAQRFAVDHASECNTGYSEPNQEFARVFAPSARRHRGPPAPTPSTPRLSQTEPTPSRPAPRTIRSGRASAARARKAATGARSVPTTRRRAPPPASK